MRYAAPIDTTGIHLSCGPLVVVDGFVEVPDTASPGDQGDLAVNGFRVAPADKPDETEAAPAVKAATKAETPPDTSTE